jgi:hypothetical protein
MPSELTISSQLGEAGWATRWLTLSSQLGEAGWAMTHWMALS